MSVRPLPDAQGVPEGTANLPTSMRPHVRTLLPLALLLTGATPLAAQDGVDERTVLDSVYSAEQALRGEETYRTVCAACHAPGFFQGTAFQFTWAGARVYDFYDLVRLTMPVDNPGGLTDQQYADVIAYIFRINGYPTGDEELAPDEEALKEIRIVEAPDPGR